VQFSENRFYASATDGFYLQANTLADLGGRHLPILEERKGYDSDGFSTERTGILRDADAILVIVNTPEERRALEGLRLWRRLPAVAAGRVVVTDSRTNYGSVFAAGACVDLLDRTYGTLA
jgi:iron complex transport system substrate-binding protein